MATDGKKVVTVLLPLALGREGVEAARQALDDPMDQGHFRLAVDLSSTSYMGSALLGCLVHGVLRARAGGGDLRLFGPGLGPDSIVAKFFARSGLGVTLQTFETEEQAIRSFQ